MLERRPEERSSIDAHGIVGAVTVAVIATAMTLLAARLVLLAPVRSIDERVFYRLVPWLQQADWLVGASLFLTDIGSKNIAYNAAAALALYVAIVNRSLRQALLIVATLIGIHGLQWLTFAVADGVVPTEHVVGNAGPFYSGGVVRALVVSGLIAFVFASRFAPRDWRVMWALPLGVGVLEAATRLVLGKHWPLDAVLAIPIGVAVLWSYQQTTVWLDGRDRRSGTLAENSLAKNDRPTGRPSGYSS